MTGDLESCLFANRWITHALRVEGREPPGVRNRFFMVTASQPERLSKCRRFDGRLHLVAGLPTPTVASAFERIRARVPTRTFSEFTGTELPKRTELSVILPPYIETSLLVEDWEACNYVPGRLGEGSSIANVITVIDADFLMDQMGSAHAIAAYGWGKTPLDSRSIADIAVGQIESATHLLVAGRSGASNSIHQMLGTLNPTASRCILEEVSSGELRDFLVAPRSPGPNADFPPTASIVPPWLEMLQSERDVRSSRERYLYRRSLPFDRERFRKWLADPPCELIRGKGKVWLADEKAWTFGYSCAGRVHRVFVAGSWWAEQPVGAWPECETQRQQLLNRWHPQFGDRRQEIAFIGVDLDPSGVQASLDACLLSEEAALESLSVFESIRQADDRSPDEQELH